MKNITILLLSVLAINAFAQSGTQTSQDNALKTRADSLNYFFGLTIGYSLESAPFAPDAGIIGRGLTEALGGNAKYDQETCKNIFQELHRELMAEIAEEEGPDAATATENEENGIAFLAKNGKRKGVTVTESGLQFEAMKMGDGPKPTATDEVEVNYEGTLIDGTVFDSSYERGKPISFPLDRVIAGWTEGLQQMPVGSIFKFYIPPELAYGPKAAGSIPPNSVLIFKVELLGIK